MENELLKVYVLGDRRQGGIEGTRNTGRGKKSSPFQDVSLKILVLISYSIN